MKQKSLRDTVAMGEIYLERVGNNHPDGEAGSGFAVTHFPFVIGRESSCDYCLYIPMISRKHCTFDMRGEQVVVRDLGSLNGTFVNARKVRGEQVVQDGDLLKVACLFYHARLAPATVVSEASTVTSGPGARTRHEVLVVDDNVDGAETLKALLQELGHRVHVAHDGQQAIKTARKHRPDAVLLDIRLPGMDGYQVARRLRDEAGLSKARLVAMSGYDLERDPQRSRSVGFDGVLPKPVDPHKLEEMLAAT
jgi:CheY-like chemotaxis protein